MKTLAPALLLLALTACATAESPASKTTGAPTTTTAQESPEAALERIEAATKDIEALQTKVTLTTEQGLLGDEQRRFGTLIYDAADEAKGEPARFALSFDRVVIDGNLEQQDRGYIFDGTWLAEKLGDQKLFIRRQLVAEGERGPSLDIGEGPFVLPLNLKKDKVLQRFDVEVVPTTADDPAETIHLKLVPKPGVDIEETQIDVWFEEPKLVPVRVVTVKSDETKQTIELRDPRVNPQISEGAFDTAAPKEGWEVEVKPLQKQ